MEINGRIIRQMVLYTLVVLIVPMILFPILLGTKLMQSSLVEFSFAFVLSEFVFYGFCIYFFNKNTNLINLLTKSAVCVVARFFVGAILGLLIAAMYAMNLEVTLSFSTASFWPAVYLHILTTPFILKPLLVNQTTNSTQSRKPLEPQRQSTSDSNDFEKTASFAASANSDEHHKNDQQVQTNYQNFQSSKPKRPNSKTSHEDGFQKAVNYIGENGTILMVAVVDVEGLLLSGYQRSMFEAEDVAPLVLPIIEQNRILLHKMKLPIPEKTDMMFENQRLIVASEKNYTLVVISERTLDDVLNIRINQALEMIRIYTAERYSDELIGNAERIYV